MARHYLWYPSRAYGARAEAFEDCERMLYDMFQLCDGIVTERAPTGTRVLIATAHRLPASETLAALFQISAEPSASVRTQLAEAAQESLLRSDIPLTHRIMLSNVIAHSARVDLLTFEPEGPVLHPDRLPLRHRILLLGELYDCLRQTQAPVLMWDVHDKFMAAGDMIRRIDKRIDQDEVRRMREVAIYLKQIGYDSRFITEQRRGRSAGNAFAAGPITEAILRQLLRETEKVRISDDARFVTVANGQSVLSDSWSDDPVDSQMPLLCSGLASAGLELAKQKDRYLHHEQSDVTLDLQALPNVIAHIESICQIHNPDAVVRTLVLSALYRRLRLPAQPSVVLRLSSSGIMLWMLWERAMGLPLDDLADLFEYYRRLTGDDAMQII